MKKKRLITWSLALSMLAANAQAAGAQVSGTTVHLQFTDKQPTAEVNGAAVQLEAPAQALNGSFYVPIRWVGEQLGFPVVWNSERRSAGLTAPKAYVEWELDRGKASVNGSEFPLEETAVLENGTLLVKLEWIAPFLDAKVAAGSNPSRAELVYVRKTDTAYRESRYAGDTQPNSRPIAIFATDKASYRIGEPVAYIDLSYDPDAEGLPKYEWSGNKDAFFEPGTHTVSLRVSDPHGEWSRPFTQTVTVTNEVFLTRAEYPWYASPVGSFVKDESAEWKSRLAGARELPAIVTRPEERKRVVSGDNHVLSQTGLVYQEQLNGKARLVSHHINGMADTVQFAAVIHNPDPARKLAVQVTRTGRLQPTLLHRYNAREAAADFLTGPEAEDLIEVKPGETVTLEQYTLAPGQGFAAICDIETDGPAVVGFTATKPNEALGQLPLTGKTVQGQAPVQGSRTAYASLRMDADADARSLTGLSQWTTGGGEDSDASMTYSMHLYHPRKAAMALLAKEGVADGTLKVNGVVVPLPQGGVTDRDGAFLFYRANGLEASVDIEWIPAPGSKLPVQWLFYPLEDKK